MRTIGFLAALAMATAAPAMAMNSGRDNSPTRAQAYVDSPTVAAVEQPCVRRVDRFGNIHVICPTMRQARAAWMMRRPSNRGNFVVYYRDGRGVRMWRSWSPRRR